MTTDSEELQVRGMKCLIEHLGVLDATRFISAILRERFDYTEWRRDHLPEEENVRALSRKASDYAATLKRQ